MIPLVQRLRLQADDLHLLAPASETVKCLMIENQNRINAIELELTDSQKSTKYDLSDTSVASLVNVALKGNK